MKGSKPCELCRVKEDKYILKNKYAYAIMDKYPVNEGHMLVIPIRHVSDYFELTKEELEAISDLVYKCKDYLDETYKPDGYNIGVNIGEYAGQTIFHTHIHFIPRYIGDVDIPRGGIRNFKKNIVEY